ncbi:hypothetical protein [Endozoicomonas montiporae]|uniref:Uncharacterized protein n=1 Tax=Endozoicomonas montiporae CL-33 TaxID=570277 RepID=A0A142B944_9GAMM|nr:hypothetical protein [Endozoicomonas montiporae]AMO55270.1 hypothetical protein EZMO1_1066 [Endozoicomonas montiporae CL-33]
MNLLTILMLLFATLAVIVMVTEKYGKPMDNEKQAKWSKIIMVLVFALILIRILKELF